MIIDKLNYGQIGQYRGTKSSRVIHLEKQITILGYTKSLKAFDIVLNTMNAENGFERHNGVHYYYHLVDVAQILLNFGIRDDDIIAAALLHDFMEDISWGTYEYVKEVFGERVADIVLRVTKDPEIDYKTDKQGMTDYLEHIFEMYESSLIKVADRMHNFGTMINSSDEHRRRQVNETRNVYIPFIKRCRNQHVRYQDFFFYAKTTIEPILYEIERSLDVARQLDNIALELSDANWLPCISCQKLKPRDTMSRHYLCPECEATVDVNIIGQYR